MDFWSWIGKARSLVFVDERGLSRYDPALVDLFAELLSEPDLLANGQARTGRHTDSSSTLYYDGEFMLVSATMARGEYVRSHNHGAWNFTGVVDGSIMYQSYERLDDGSVPNYADLHQLDGELLVAGSVGVCPPPPHDIHEVLALAERSTTVLLAPQFSPSRQYYYPQNKCYIESTTYPATDNDGRR
jgi:predicted metal-dependent enzyme (double-stranded beta helix superfamily)